MDAVAEEDHKSTSDTKALLETPKELNSNIPKNEESNGGGDTGDVTSNTEQPNLCSSWEEFQNLVNQSVTSSEEPGIVLPRPLVPPHLAVYVLHNTPPTKAQLGRPAPKQVENTESIKQGYVQGRDELNIWYGLCPTDGFDFYNRANREPAITRCNPFTDSGWTDATLEEEKDPNGVTPFCLYFAKGMCNYGSQCKFHHRVPSEVDSNKLDPVVDIFGRSRHSSHRTDMDGVGSFQLDCRTLFVGDLTFLRSDPNYHQTMVNVLFRYFCNWGPLENVKVIPSKAIAFLRYKYRAAAEFAKVAMAEQSIEDYGKQICVRWAHPDRNPRAQADIEAREWSYYKDTVEKRMHELDLPKDTLLVYRDLFVHDNTVGQLKNEESKKRKETGPYALPPPSETLPSNKNVTKSQKPLGPESIQDVYEHELKKEEEERVTAMKESVARMNRLMKAVTDDDADDFTVII